MFGKKQTNSGPPKKKPPKVEAPEEAVEAPSVEEEAKAPVAEVKPEKAPESPKKPEKAPVEAEDNAAMLEGLDEALKTPDEEPKQDKSPKKAEKPKPSSDEDPFAADLAGVDAEAAQEAEDEDSVTNIRLKRARNRIWLDLRDGIDLKALARMDGQAARDEVQSAVEEIARFRNLDLTPAELQSIAKECGDDMLGFGPLEELLVRDDIADIMINGPDVTYIEVGGKIEKPQSSSVTTNI